MATTDIYRIKTRNSVYEIQVRDQDGTTNRPSRCRKEGESTWRRVTDFSGDYLEKLCIGPAFDIPGVVTTSNVVDYVHFVLSTEPKRKAKAAASGIGEFFDMLGKHVVDQAKPKPFDRAKYQAHQDAAVALAERQRVFSPCKVEGCTVDSPAWHEGSPRCKSGSIASGGDRSHCTCSRCY